MKSVKSILITVMVCAISLTIHAQDGRQAYQFLNQTSSARIYGLGGVNISTVEDDISVADMNPALIGPEMNMQTAVNYMYYVGGSNFAGLKYTHRSGERAAWSAGIQYLGYGSMKWTDETGAILGDFKAQDVVFSGTYTHDITDRLRGGVALKFAYSSYESYSALAIATDLGINYYNPDRDLSLSLVVANLGGQVKRFDNSYDKLPIDVRLGWTQSFGNLPVRFNVTAWNLTKWSLPYYSGGDGTPGNEPELKDNFASNLFRHLIFGLDFIPSDKFYITLGFNYKTRTDMSTYSRNIISGFTLGAGLNVNKFGIGLAFAQPHSGATTFMVNLNLHLSDLIH